MYIISLGNTQVIFGLSSETKPDTVLDGSLFLETDTSHLFSSVSNAWVLKTTGAELSLSDITTNDVNTSRHGFFPKLPTPTGKFLKDDLTWVAIAASGDVVGPIVSVASQIALFDGTTGKLVKADTTTGIVKASAGVISDAIADTDYASVASMALKAPLASPTFTGTVSGITAAMVGAIASIIETEIDVGTTPVAEASVNVVNASINTNSKILGGAAYKAATGKDLDECEMDALELKFQPLAGSMNVSIKGLDGYIADKFIIWYAFA